MADHFPAFPAEYHFCVFGVAIGFPLSVDTRTWHTATDSFELQRKTYSRLWINSDKPISIINRLASRNQLFAAGPPLDDNFGLSPWNWFFAILRESSL